MEWNPIPVLAGMLPAALALLLLSAGIEDARRREIANWKNAAVALLAPLWWWAQGYVLWPDVAGQLLLFAGVFALFVLAFHLGQMGGGDVKLIAALALWLPLGPMMWMLAAMSLAGGAITLLMLLDRAWRRVRAGGAAIPGAIEVPYGVAIAAAALLALPRTAS